MLIRGCYELCELACLSTIVPLLLTQLLFYALSLLSVFPDCITTSAPAVGCGVSSGVSVKASAPAWRKEPTS